jgi:hypothetical protein
LAAATSARGKPPRNERRRRPDIGGRSVATTSPTLACRISPPRGCAASALPPSTASARCAAPSCARGSPHPPRCPC